MPLRKLCLCFLGAALAASVLTTGCRSHHDDRRDDNQPAQNDAQPTQDETVIYNRWEVETHREHKDIHQRPPEEQKEYGDWRRQHPDNH
jgi:hypothetical protein